MALSITSFSALLAPNDFMIGASAAPIVRSAQWNEREEAAEKAFLAGRYKEAEKDWEAALAIAEKEDPNGATVADTLNQMTHLHIKQKNYTRASNELTRALEIRTKLLGATDQQTLETMGNLALVKHKLGHEYEAEKLYKDVLENKRKSGAKATSIAITLNNLGNLYADLHRCDPAKKAYSEALEIEEKEFGPQHLEVGNDHFNLGALMYRCNQFEAALPHLQKAEEIFKAKGHIESQVRALHYLGMTHARLKQTEHAITHYKEALRIHEAHKGKGHVDTVPHVLNLAKNIAELGKDDEAEKLFQEALATAEKHPHNVVALTEAQLDFGHFYKQRQKFDKAEEYYKLALANYEKLSRHQQRKLYEVPRAYADLLFEQKREDESTKMAQKYLHLYKPEPGEQIK